MRSNRFKRLGLFRNLTRTLSASEWAFEAQSLLRAARAEAAIGAKAAAKETDPVMAGHYLGVTRKLAEHTYDRSEAARRGVDLP